MENILKIENTTKYYGDILGVKDLSLSLNKGEVFGFIGPNGAGKSTTIRTIMNLINKNHGKIYVEEEIFDKDNIKLKKDVGYLPSEIHLYSDLTVKKMLDYHETFYEKNIKDRRKKLVKMLELDESKNIDDLSFGNLKKLGIILAFMHEPKLLILDEPTSGLDPLMQQKFYQLLEEEKKKGTTILYSTHVLSEVSKICDRVGIIKNGCLLKIETIKELKNKSLTFVTIESKDIKEIKKDLKISPLFENENLIKFKNLIKADLLIKKISKYNIENILIEEASLEEVFFHYYQ